MKYQVLVQHFGDKQYWAGDVREIDNEQDAQALIDMGLIALFDGQDDNQEKPKKSTKKIVEQDNG